MSKGKKRQAAAERRAAKTVTRPKPVMLSLKEKRELTERAKASGLATNRLYPAWEIQRMLELAVASVQSEWIQNVQTAIAQQSEQVDSALAKSA